RGVAHDDAPRTEQSRPDGDRESDRPRADHEHVLSRPEPRPVDGVETDRERLDHRPVRARDAVGQPERHALARDRVLGVAPADVAEAGGPQRRAAHDVARETREAVAAADARHRADAIALAPGPVRSAGALPDRGDLARELVTHHGTARKDRKSTRLNSSHVKISYAV